MRFAKNILLTGAGFTKTFGGYLGSEMWAVIFNQPEVQSDEGLRSLMLEKGFNYEWIFEDVLSSSKYNDTQKNSFNKALKRAYEEMDSAIYEHSTNFIAGRACCSNFVSRFARIHDGRPFFFTLNQDIFVERFFSTANSMIAIPGLYLSTWFNNHIGPSLLPSEIVTLPSEAEVERIKQEFWEKRNNNFKYVKLHGSYAWKTFDGSEVMVVGQGKQGRIEKEPLLRWYLSLFEDCVNEGDKNLVLIGYGFADEHINNIIADAVRDHGLRLFIISPQLPADFQQDLSGVHGANTELKLRGDEIWNGLHGYYRGMVTEFYRMGGESLPPCGEKLFSNLDMR